MSYKTIFFSEKKLKVLNFGLKQEGYPPACAGYGANIANQYNANEQSGIRRNLESIASMTHDEIELFASRI